MIIWDEYEYGKQIYEQKTVKTKRWQYNELKCLIKYMNTEKFQLKQIREKLLECCNDDIYYLNKKQITNIFNKLIQQARKEPLVHNKPIVIYKSEIDKIKDIDNKKLEQILFMLLVYRKWVGDGNLEWFSILKSDILKESKIGNVNNNTLQNYLTELLNCGFIDSDVRLVNKKYRKKNKDTKKQEWKVNILEAGGDVAFQFDNYHNFVYRYLNYVYGGYFECKECGGMFVAKNNKQKYCKTCAKAVKSVQNKEYRNKL